MLSHFANAISQEPPRAKIHTPLTYTLKLNSINGREAGTVKNRKNMMLDNLEASSVCCKSIISVLGSYKDFKSMISTDVQSQLSQVSQCSQLSLESRRVKMSQKVMAHHYPGLSESAIFNLQLARRWQSHVKGKKESWVAGIIPNEAFLRMLKYIQFSTVFSAFTSLSRECRKLIFHSYEALHKERAI